jgi:2-polyprenyl-3-methyl-5-hydroxy-6-metoxy-1,4-benzoquinol methylase
MKEIVICPVCKGTFFEKKIDTIDHTATHEIFQIKVCLNCSLLITTPRPEGPELHKYYLSENYISHSNKANSLINAIYLIARKFTLRWKYNLLRKYSTGTNLLDYGCGTGDFLKYCSKRGMATNGVEPSAPARIAANANLKSEAIFEDVGGYLSRADVITLWHVLEHLPDLKESLLKLKSKLAKNGIILLAVPNPNSWESKHYANFWAGYDTPRHLWHFPQKSMRLLLRDSGLELIDVKPMKLDAFYISLLSEKYKNNGHLGLTGMITAFTNGLKSNVKASKSGEYSSLIYIARNDN